MFVLKQPAMSLPMSFLFDGEGQLAVIYQGPIGAEQLTDDLSLFNLGAQGIFQAACPFPGRWQPETARTARSSGP